MHHVEQQLSAAQSIHNENRVLSGQNAHLAQQLQGCEQMLQHMELDVHQAQEAKR